MKYELKRDNRFKVEFPVEFNIDGWQVQYCSKPKLVESIWEDIVIEFIDPIGPSTSQALFHNVHKTNINKFTLFLYGLDPVGVEVEKWEIRVSRVKSIDFGQYSYENDTISKPKMILAVKDCILNY